MIEFRWNKIDKKSNTPVIKDVELDELAEMLLKDYKSALLKEPRKIGSNLIKWTLQVLGKKPLLSLAISIFQLREI
ncbi:hypothetical protein ACHAL6_03980 [Proteiniclasticum sp. C24MP]|uniref:hypothetical protein n=1 Tax=Proteiniclasticum sp. C24MP TaxID=3374101 RepID=UPI00375468F1